MTGYGCDLYVEHIQHKTRAYIFQVRKMKPMWKCLKPEFYLKIIWWYLVANLGHAMEDYLYSLDNDWSVTNCWARSFTAYPQPLFSAGKKGLCKPVGDVMIATSIFYTVHGFGANFKWLLEELQLLPLHIGFIFQNIWFEFVVLLDQHSWSAKT